ncbi:MAG: hypothetical protein ABI847_03970 [Anaerolineales bacterium]
MKIVAIIASLSLLFAACSSPTPSPTPLATAGGTVSSPTQAAKTPIPAVTMAAGEVVKLSGDTFTTSDPFHMDGAATLAITWNYTGSGPFALWLINVSEEVTDPQYDRMLITDVDGAPSGTATQAVIAGDYAVQVEQADGPWTVDIKVAP